MAKEILLYQSLYSWTAEQFINELDESKDKEIVVRMNTPGGEVYQCYGMIAKFQEHAGKKTIKVDGIAASAGAFMLCFMGEGDNAECLDVSEFLFHRAAYPSWIENDKARFTPEKKASLEKMNKTLRAGMESKFTAEEWESVTGVTLDELFSLEQRIDVVLNAEQAKKLGLISKINKITPEKKAEIDSIGLAVAKASIDCRINTSTSSEEATPTSSNHQINHNNKNNSVMTIEKLKAEHPEVYKQVFESGVAQERDRVCAYMTFAHLDIDAVKASIQKGETMTQTQMAEFSLKAVSQNTLNKLESNSPEAVETKPEANAKTDAEKQLEEFQKEAFGLAGIN